MEAAGVMEFEKTRCLMRWILARGLRRRLVGISSVLFALFSFDSAQAQLFERAVVLQGARLVTMAGEPIKDGVVVITDGKIVEVGPASAVRIPDGHRTLTAKVVTPGLVDAHTVVGLTGYMNQDQDQDQLERSGPIHPELRAIDAYNPQERLVQWLREFGITTIHTGHAPGLPLSGQTMIAKTTGETVEEAVRVPTAMLAVTLGRDAAGKTKGKDATPGTRAKVMAVLRAELIKAQDYSRKLETAKEDKKPARDLRLEMLARVLDGEVRLLITAHKAHDIISALRLADKGCSSAAKAKFESPTTRTAVTPRRRCSMSISLVEDARRKQVDRRSGNPKSRGGLRRASNSRAGFPRMHR
ncbi:MAG: hypothetical protein IH987_09300 [Planctomycetes bacterium]|nr:hypothetical protein [Planctomycetota bacterium]